MGMKCFSASLCACLALFATACSQSPQRLVEAGNRYHDKHKYQEASILYRKAIAKDKTYAEAYYREGLNLLEQKNAVESAKFLRRAVDLNPNNSDAEVKLSEIYLTAYAYDQKKFRSLLPEVRELTAKILQRNPRDFHGVRLQAFLYLTDKDLPKALATFEEANRLQPYSREVVGWLAQVLTANNQFDEAEKLARDMIAHDKSWGPAYDFLFVQYMQRKRTADAEAVLKQRVANDPASDVAIINYSNYLLQTGRYDEAEGQMKKVLADAKRFPNGHQLVGDFYMRANRFEQAAHEYTEGISADPKNKLNYQMHLVGALVRQGAKSPQKQVDALNLAKNLAAEHPKDVAASQLYASLLLETGVKQDVQKSLAELKNLVQTNNTDAVLHFDLARAYYAQRDLDKAQSETLEAVRLRPGLLPARVLAARVYEDRGQHGKALEQTGIVLERQPNDAQAQLIRIQAHIGLKEGDKVRPDLEALVKQNPGFGDAVYQLATLYMAGKQYAKAQEQFQTLWDGAGPNKQPDLRGFIGLQEVKLRQGHADQAIDALRDLVQKNPNQPSLRLTLANFQAEAALQLPASNADRQPLIEKAAANYQQIAKSLPDASETYIRLGTLYRMLNRNDDAIKAFDDAAKADPRNTEAFLNRAMVFEATGQKEKARAAYAQTLGVDPDNVIALNNLAFMNADANQNLDQAMTYAERAKKRLPTNASVSDTLGYVYLRKNLNEDAVRELQSAVDRDPKNASYRLHLAMALLKRGDKTGARREAAAALRTADTDQQEKIRTFISQIS
jgi:tetratricopeptide (TPR) repeat protein